MSSTLASGHGSTSLNSHLLGLLLLVSTASQSPLIVTIPTVHLFVLGAWGVFFMHLLLANTRRPIQKLLFVAIILLSAFDVCVLLLSLVFERDYYDSPIFYAAHVALAVVCVGAWVGPEESATTTLRICVPYFLAGAGVVAVALYVNNFLGVNWIGSMGYIYASKNSVAPILLSAAIASLVLGTPKSLIVRASFAVALCTMILMLKSRATILGGLAALIYAAVAIPKRPSTRVAALAAIAGVAVLLLSIPLSNDFIVNGIVLNNRGDMGADAVLSGRLSHWEEFVILFGDRPLSGNGPVYLESFPLASLATFGAIAVLPLFGIVCLPIAVAWGAIPRRGGGEWSVAGHALSMLWIAMTLNGIFEEMAPLGPGLKTVALWLLTGICISGKGMMYHRRSASDVGPKTLALQGSEPPKHIKL